jgi:sec-independent protein translocase protein TatC
MTIGEHLEELRTRLIYALIGFVAVAIVFLAFEKPVMRAFLRPLMIGLERNNLPPQVVFSEISESFMVYIRVSLICAAAVASPWMLYQLWQFVAAGLYPSERKYITKYLPLSITLLITGMLFLYFFVLPLMIEFFLKFDFGEPFRNVAAHQAQVAAAATTQAAPGAVVVPYVAGDPPNPVNGQVWFDTDELRLKIVINGTIRTFQLASSSLATPQIRLDPYIDMVVEMLLAFGLAFQLPLVVLALVRIGILELEQVKKLRKIVYFVLAVLAAVIVPDVVTGMIALVVPLIILFEFGLWLAREPKQQATSN